MMTQQDFHVRIQTASRIPPPTYPHPPLHTTTTSIDASSSYHCPFMPSIPLPRAAAHALSSDTHIDLAPILVTVVASGVHECRHLDSCGGAFVGVSGPGCCSRSAAAPTQLLSPVIVESLS